MIVHVALEFEDVASGSNEGRDIIQQIMESCYTIQTGFDAQGCWINHVENTENVEQD